MCGCSQESKPKPTPTGRDCGCAHAEKRDKGRRRRRDPDPAEGYFGEVRRRLIINHRMGSRQAASLIHRWRQLVSAKMREGRSPAYTAEHVDRFQRQRVVVPATEASGDAARDPLRLEYNRYSTESPWEVWHGRHIVGAWERKLDAIRAIPSIQREIHRRSDRPPTRDKRRGRDPSRSYTRYIEGHKVMFVQVGPAGAWQARVIGRRGHQLPGLGGRTAAEAEARTRALLRMAQAKS